MHPLNIRKHFHVNIGKLGLRPAKTKVFKKREDANTYARTLAKKEAKKFGKPFKGGSFGSSSLAFYAIDKNCIEVIRCNESGTKHRE